jgi:hypothetical protein
MRTKLVVTLVAVLLLAVACGGGQKVGNEKILDFEEQENAQALGREAAQTPKPLTVGAKTPTPRPVVTDRPKATPVIFDVELVTNSPFYKPGNCILIQQGVSVRVTNKDNTPERKSGRSFTDKAGSFHSGLLKPGQSWTWVFDAPGSFEVIDEGLTFATAVLHVGQGSCK